MPPANPTQCGVYLWTLDSHECFGPFRTFVSAHAWAVESEKHAYRLLDKPPYETTVVIAPYRPRNTPPHKPASRHVPSLPSFSWDN